MLSTISSIVVLIEHSFLKAYDGESRDGSSTANFFTGDILSLNSEVTPSHSKASLCQNERHNSPQAFASWLEVSPFFLLVDSRFGPQKMDDALSWTLLYWHEVWYFQVVYVSGDNLVDLIYMFSTNQMLKNGKESNRKGQVMQNWDFWNGFQF